MSLSSTSSPVTGSTHEIRSISSPKSCTRMPRSSYAGKISMVSPRTRNLFRTNAMSLRSYCSSTRRLRISRWSCSSPTFSVSSWVAYVSGEPRP